VTFEKWQALGNDYVILEQEDLPFELTPSRVAKLCAPHTGIGSDGVLLLSATDEPGFVAALRIFNPDGSEAELSGNGAREAALYLRRHDRARTDTFSIITKAGEIRPTITGTTTCTMDMGRARQIDAGELVSAGHTFRYRAIEIGNPQCAIVVDDPDALDLQAVGPPIEHNRLFPNRTNVSFYAERAPGTIRARIFERGVGETLASGTGASGAAVAYVLAGGDSPVTVQLDGGELEVEVEEDLHVNLTGWAVPVYRGELADEFIEELHATR
jgi:diaminopimelate epimerase